MHLRFYRPEDLGEVGALFYETVHGLTAGDYTEEQRRAWAPSPLLPARWQDSLTKNKTLLAFQERKLVGFGDFEAPDLLNRLYVHKDHSKQGIGSVLCAALEAFCLDRPLYAHVSVTAQPFFLKRGYLLLSQQQVLRQGVLLENALMVKHPSSPNN